MPMRTNCGSRAKLRSWNTYDRTSPTSTSRTGESTPSLRDTPDTATTTAVRPATLSNTVTDQAYDQFAVPAGRPLRPSRTPGIVHCGLLARAELGVRPGL